MNNPIVFSAATPSYFRALSRLRLSCAKVGAPLQVVELVDRGSWQANMAQKPSAILEALKERVAAGDGRPLLWVDADAVLHQWPISFPHFDISFHRSPVNRELRSGTLLLRPTPAMLELCQEWKNRQSRAPDIWDQENLDIAVTREGIKAGQLPVEMCFIWDIDRRGHPDAVPLIEHFQESRRYRDGKLKPGEAPEPPVSIIITEYGKPELADALVAQLRTHEPNTPVILVDDHPRRTRHAPPPGAAYLWTGGDWGITEAWDRAIALAQGEHVVLLNNDITCGEPFVQTMLSACGEDRISGPALKRDPTTGRNFFPGWCMAFHRGLWSHAATAGMKLYFSDAAFQFASGASLQPTEVPLIHQGHATCHSPAVRPRTRKLWVNDYFAYLHRFMPPSVIIVGKGPSARPVKADEPGIIVALNGAVRLCERVDVLFVNDLSAFSEFDRWDLEKVGLIVIPTELHLHGSPKERVDWQLIKPLLCGRHYDLHVLPSAGHKRADLPSFGPQISVGETAIGYMLEKGYREFLTVGIDPGGGYSGKFQGGAQIAKPNEHFLSNWLRMERRVTTAGGTIRRDGVGEPDYWDSEHGLANHTPALLDDPEGWDVAAWLAQNIKGVAVEVGCGRGRLARDFEPDRYLGLDISVKAVALARQNRPEHLFELMPEGRLPPARNYLLYTVCLHLDDAALKMLLARVCQAANRVWIAEIMERRFRNSEQQPPAFNREPEEYEKLLRKLGMKVARAWQFPYKRYKDAQLTIIEAVPCH